MSQQTVYIYFKLVMIDIDDRIHTFRIKQTDQMGELMDKYSELVGLPTPSLRFTYNGQRIQHDMSVKALELKVKHNVIKVFKEQQLTEHIILELFDNYLEVGKIDYFRVKQTDQLGKVMNDYSKLVGIPVRRLRFLYDGRRCCETHTPKELEMDHYVMDVFVEQRG